ncbi:unnamed protein product [Anisakis simplex]|uniref:ANF_receptor domain-containing protein n=1 Tax=Anisakis simplex TaxID=6269 RepID=A0A158PN26_ANISI|nr:unnamed protein product [Anisakis simplex]
MFGAVLDEKSDAHLVLAMDYAVDWLNAHESQQQHIEYQIEFVRSDDYFDAVTSVCRLLEHEKVVALFGSSNMLLNDHIERLANQALQVGLIELKHWFMFTSIVSFLAILIACAFLLSILNLSAVKNSDERCTLDMRTLDMELFRHNHARFIAVDTTDPKFIAEQANAFNYSSFVTYITERCTHCTYANRNIRTSESALMFDAVLMAADAIKILKSDEKITTRCRSPSHPHRAFTSGTKLIHALRNTLANTAPVGTLYA